MEGNNYECRIFPYQTFEVFQIGDIGAGGDQDILLVDGVDGELVYDARVYKQSGDEYVLDAELTKEWNEEYSNVMEWGA